MSLMPMPFSNPTTYPGHGGVDFPVPGGLAAPAITDGVVTYAAWWGNGGNTKTITRADGLQIMYCHLRDLSGPALGSRVRLGDRFGVVGSTGHSTGNHLHLEMWRRGIAQDEWRWMDRNNWVGKSTSPAGGGITPITEKSKRSKDMLMIHRPKAGAARGVEYAIFEAGFWFPFTTGDPVVSDGFANQVGGSSVPVDDAFWEYCRRATLMGAVMEEIEKMLSEVEIGGGTPADLTKVLADIAATKKAVDATPAAVRQQFVNNPLK